LTAVATTGATIQVRLAWTNPTDADFTGVMIRRAVGATAPTVSSGTLLIADTPQTSYINSVGLEPCTQYSYAVFAHDGVPNQSVPANVTVATKAAANVATTAVLQVTPAGLFPNNINPLGLAPNNKLTVNATSFFDATCSAARAGTTLTSGSLTFGDGQTFTFPEPFGPVNFWTTFHSYAATGPQTVTLTVTDSAGTTATTTVTVNVFDPPTASVAVASSAARVFTFALGSATPAGTELNSYFLEFSPAIGVVQDPVPETFRFTARTAPPATQDVTFTIPGTYTVKFFDLNDAGGSTAAAPITVVVP
jgi:hypothetical protein